MPKISRLGAPNGVANKADFYHDPSGSKLEPISARAVPMAAVWEGFTGNQRYSTLLTRQPREAAMIEGFVGFSTIPFSKVNPCEKFRRGGRWYQKYFGSQEDQFVARPLQPNTQQGEPQPWGELLFSEASVEAVWQPGR